ncbi:hypothetical protein FPV67DRAFT_1503373 [Lyophyllum atratum]|nr:hypothetical protein FPV67DRAFT_1503373 [Lyophyllum atratum]
MFNTRTSMSCHRRQKIQSCLTFYLLAVTRASQWACVMVLHPRRYAAMRYHAISKLGQKWTYLRGFSYHILLDRKSPILGATKTAKLS